jgi:hypothetical protein
MAWLLVGVMTLAACGKKGPPLPPIVRVPAAPAGFMAERRGDTVDITFMVPAANVDGTRPANVQRVEVYGYTGPATVSAAEIVKQGTRIGSVDVKRPRDPNRIIDPDEPESDIEPLLDTGLDQGASVRLSETVAEEVQKAAAASEAADPASSGVVLADAPQGPDAGNRTLSRRYVAVPINTRGQRGPLSQAAGVPLVPAPAAPAEPKVSYDEKAVTVAPAATLSTVLQSLAPGQKTPATSSYHVYRVAEGTETRLTKTPMTAPSFADQQIAWGAERCYVLRVVVTSGGAAVESEASPAACVTLTDTFAPAAPTGVEAIASEGTIGLIWDPNGEPDLAGYVVLRGPDPGGPMQPISPGPFTVTRFNDSVPPGSRFFYAVQAIDIAGNVSPPSELVEETAR